MPAGVRPVSLVTGASYGIGAAITAALAAAGHDLALFDLDTAMLAKSAARAAECGARVATIAHDLRDHRSIGAGVATALAQFGRIDNLVNNAGVPLPVAALDVTRANWETIMSVNMAGTFFMSQAVGRHLIEAQRQGCIVSIASAHAFVGSAAGQILYGMSKAAIVHITRMLAIEWAGHGIRVNAVAPGKVETDSPARLANQANPEKRAQMLARIPAGRFGTSEEVAALVRYLLTPEAAYITGQTVILDGGVTAQ